MKYFLLAVLFVAAQGQPKTFDVKDDKNNTCLKLQLEGRVDLTHIAATPVTLDFANASVIIKSSNCTAITLNLTKSVEVTFLFSNVSGPSKEAPIEWKVTPLVQLVPKSAFPNIPVLNITDNATYRGADLDAHFYKNESYTCKANTDLSFNQTSKGELNITVKVQTSNFKIQALLADKFTNGVVCDADKPTIAPPTVPTTGAPITPPPTNQNFSCDDNLVTKFRVLGSFALSITYNTTDKKTKTVDIPVPQVAMDVNASDCKTSNVTEKLFFEFYTNWSIEIVFKIDNPKGQLLGASSKYYVSNITINYEYNNLLPNSSSKGSAVAHSNKDKYLEASANGYYTCKDISLPINEDVKLKAKEFKYKAFNTKGDIDFKGDVTECPGDEETSSVVPIAVGAALAGLVLIVLIAYLIGRRRSRKSGYESV